MCGAHSYHGGSTPCSSNSFRIQRHSHCSNGLVPHLTSNNLQHGSYSSGSGMMQGRSRVWPMAHNRTNSPQSFGGLSDPSGYEGATMGQQSMGMQQPLGLGPALNGVQPLPQNAGMNIGTGMGMGMGMNIFSNPWGLFNGFGQQRTAASNSSHRTSEKKDICVRGTYYAVRKSYLAENKNFEENLIKYMDKKSETEVPDFMIDMLVKCINDDSYTCTNILDEVTLYILASSVGASSVKETAFAHIKKFDLATTRIYPEDLIMVTVAILCADKTDDGLKEWLRNMLCSDLEVATFVDCCLRSPVMCVERPEAVLAYERFVNPNRFPALIPWRSP